MLDLFSAWHGQAEKLKSGEIATDQYNAWRYNYPKGAAERTKQHFDALQAEESGANKNE